MRKECADLVALLTPIVKAFFTDNAWIATSHCMQVFGGHGYIREWGMEQFVRDARINMIYEGTNTIQSLDLLGRKVLSDNGAKLKKFGKLVAGFVEEEGVDEAMQEFVNPLADLGEQGHQADHRDRHEGASRTPTRSAPRRSTTCASAATWCSRYFWARMAKVALEKDRGGDDRSIVAKLATARFYFAKLLPETAALIRTARAGAAPMMDDGRGAVLTALAAHAMTDLAPKHRCVAWPALRRLGLVALAQADAGRPVEDRRRRHQEGEVAGAHRRDQRRLQRQGREDPRPGDAPDAVCKDCSDDRKDKPILGMTIIRDVEASDERQGGIRGRRHPRSRTTARSTGWS